MGLIALFTLSLHAIKIPQEKKPPQKEVYEKVWEKTYGGDEDDIAHDIVALDNAQSVIVGTCKSFAQSGSQICVIRMDAKGTVVWQLLLGGDKEDKGRAITRASDGMLYILGTTKSLATNYDRDIYVAKVSLEGKLLWERGIGGELDEKAGGIVGTDDGGVVVVGSSESFGDRYGDIYIAKLDKEGNSVSARTIGGKKTEEAHALTRLKDGTLVMVGMRATNNRNYEEFFIVKLDQNAKVLWTKTFGDYDDDSLEGVVGTMDGGMVAVGKTRSYGSQQTDLTVMKLSKDGKVLWHKVYGFKYYEYGNCVTTTADGGFMLAGATSTLGKGSHSVYMMALDKDGKLIWSHVYGGENRDIAHGMARMSDGTVMTVGQSESFSRSKGFYMINVDKAKVEVKAEVKKVSTKSK